MKAAKRALYKYVSILLFTVLLCGMAYMEAHLKRDSQFYLIGFSALTLLLLFTRLTEAATVLFFILLGVIFYCNYFLLFAQLTPDHLGITSMIFASAFSLVTLFVYFKYFPRQRVLEKYFVLAFLVMSVIIFFLYEL